MNRLFKKALAAIKNPKKLFRLVWKQFYVLLKFGPFQYVDYVKRAFGRHMFIHNFPNGIRTSLDEKKARNWYLLNRKPLLIILLGAPNTDISTWFVKTQRETQSHFFVGHETIPFLKSVDKALYTEISAIDTATTTDIVAIRSQAQQYFRGNDVFFIDITQPLIDSFAIVRIQHATYSYDDDKEVGFVMPAYQTKNSTIAGFEYDKSVAEWTPMTQTETDYGQTTIPRYCLTAVIHGLYMTHKTLQGITLSHSDEHTTTQDQVSTLIANGWMQNVRTLVFSSVILQVNSVQTPALNDIHEKWFNGRVVKNAMGDTKVIYVLNATSVSGGIRVIFEHANGLVARGFDVEIWSLQGQPTWTDLNITVKKFRTYSDLLIGLRNEDAIKVATWWETAQIVWLGSVNKGIPVNFIQEFETWFYPEDTIARAAVVSSYRKEFTYMTTAQYQQTELKAIGIDSPIIPVGYEQKYYHQNSKTKREEDVVLALGRSFFQKNFAMTARAWKSITGDRPRLFLFGSEPDVLQDDKVTYHVKPTNEGVNILYNQATCFVQTSRHEGFSLPIIEAMAAGCPVITTDSHGNRGFCHDGVNCLIVEQDNDAQLAEAIQKLLGDKALQEKFRAEGLKTAAQYEWSGILDRLAVFYKAL
ncbi:glycosyltransferase [bacterium]|nr:MAG: glycosyltransferase [bacterium]